MTEHTSTGLFMSRLLLNPHSRQVINEMAYPYEMHRTLMRAFPKATNEASSKARSKFDVLFRADIDDIFDVIKVYVQSNVKPNWSFLQGMHNYLCQTSGLPEYEYKEVMSSWQKIEIGQVMRFRLRANPTKRIGKVTTGDSDLRGKRVGLLREEQQIEWLIRKGVGRENDTPGGFEILMNYIISDNGKLMQVPYINVGRENSRRGRLKRGGHSFETTHVAVCFEGLLRVTDAHAFRNTLVRGIGSGKAFGFGLLSVIPERKF